MLDSCRAMENEGFRVTYLPVKNNGIIDLQVCEYFTRCELSCDQLPWLQDLESALTPDTSLVSIMTVNNEIGVRQPMKEIGKQSTALCVCVSMFTDRTCYFR